MPSLVSGRLELRRGAAERDRRNPGPSVRGIPILADVAPVSDARSDAPPAGAPAALSPRALLLFPTRHPTRPFGAPARSPRACELPGHSDRRTLGPSVRGIPILADVAPVSDARSAAPPAGAP